MTEEKQLIRRMLGGDEQAFEAFFNAYFARIYRFALPRLNGDADAAREVVQSTLAKAMRRIGDFRGESALFTWICQICRREAVDYIRSSRRHSRNVVLIDDRPELRAAIEALEAPEEFDLVKSYGRAEVGRLVRVVLDRLPANYGNALEWKYMEGNSSRRSASGWVSARSPRSPCSPGRASHSARHWNRYSAPRRRTLPRASAREGET
jgi:RNA polymerase sigma-70 factor (ECF subfamily)